MVCQVIDEAGEPMDAHFDLEGRDVIFHSRGGAKGRGARNADYGIALRLLLRRLETSSVTVEGAWVDSSQVQALPLEARLILRPEEAGVSAAEAFTLMSSRMKSVGSAAATPRAKGNSTKRIRIRLASVGSAKEVLQVLGGRTVQTDIRSLDRLSASDLEKVSADHVWRAVQRLRAGDVEHPFGASTDFDLIADGHARLPPKAVFGLAASEALGFEVQPRHFSGGVGTPCFRVLEAAGFTIVPKGAETHEDPLLTPDERAWAEGREKLVSHLKRERAAGLSKAKKASFIKEHGRLSCERCGMDPQTVYGDPHGEACIEVHHSAIQLQEMDEGHVTKLEDLECLCANCHRVVHRLLKNRPPNEALVQRFGCGSSR